MSEHHFCPAFEFPRTVSYALFSLLLASSCQSSGTEPAATTAEPTVTAAAVTTASTAAPTGAPASATVEAPATTQAAAPAEEAEKPEAKSAAGAKPATDTKPGKGEEPAKTDPQPKPETAKPDEPKPEAPVIEKPCLAKTFEFVSVRKACEKGGVPKAKGLMKAWTNKAKDKGESYKCATCHDNQKTYTNKPTAAADLRKLLDIIK
jgi:hypothetical protein